MYSYEQLMAGKQSKKGWLWVMVAIPCSSSDCDNLRESSRSIRLHISLVKQSHVPEDGITQLSVLLSLIFILSSNFSRKGLQQNVPVKVHLESDLARHWSVLSWIVQTASSKLLITIKSKDSWLHKSIIFMMTIVKRSFFKNYISFDCAIAY